MSNFGYVAQATVISAVLLATLSSCTKVMRRLHQTCCGGRSLAP
ncbi:Hypothetical Protein XCAW_03454 [Xanthomonas citri subsp. citri Aw12879]|nr:Hypothetical Protein XCAW_03454 [Xanthomonas citri subsp. citri Aw12879]